MVKFAYVSLVVAAILLAGTYAQAPLDDDTYAYDDQPAADYDDADGGHLERRGWGGFGGDLGGYGGGLGGYGGGFGGGLGGYGGFGAFPRVVSTNRFIKARVRKNQALRFNAHRNKNFKNNNRVFVKG
ncbi:hypothetical protein IWQ62_002497 [Dispira parvispora]|uniref:Uncharacterized protein n=1 Tax=Dispira parvispora TaxID=1520584 RepID=A0A9W8AWL2_9FUNG|nr:hypothetical protein IWQ62_002497 [Dispira parvispora]